MMGVGADRREEKSISWVGGMGRGVGSLSVLGEPGSERNEDVERRFVLAGVRRG